MAELIPKIRTQKSTAEIPYRSAINRLYYGIYHLVQREYQVSIPASEVNRCHAFVKQKIQNLPIKGDYADLEEYRVHADYRISEPLLQRDLEDAQILAQRLKTSILGEGEVRYHEKDDVDYYFRVKSP